MITKTPKKQTKPKMEYFLVMQKKVPTFLFFFATLNNKSLLFVYSEGAPLEKKQFRVSEIRAGRFSVCQMHLTGEAWNKSR